ncbi:MAG TPA: thiamine diphosphokinase [Gaiellaceae bacterium]|nr:thiamine diphosphokinase [Gaiellaceae bacterium]
MLVVVLAAGAVLDDVPDGAFVIAADSGAEAGVHVDLAVGDFDSISSETLAGLDRVEPYPPEKDATDLELALETALREGATRVLVVGSSGGRLDHLLGSLLLLASEKWAGVEVDAQLGGAQVHVIRGSRMLRGAVGETVSLFAVGGLAEGVTTEGLAYPLADETLPPDTSRGVSNLFHDAEARITVARGVLLAVRPGSTSM